MIILSWNVRILNSTYHQRSIHDLIVTHSQDVFFVQVTNVSIEGMHHHALPIWYTGHYQSVRLQGNFAILALF